MLTSGLCNVPCDCISSVVLGLIHRWYVMLDHQTSILMMVSEIFAWLTDAAAPFLKTLD